jgi:hypothetical protein
MIEVPAGFVIFCCLVGFIIWTWTIYTLGLAHGRLEGKE